MSAEPLTIKCYSNKKHSNFHIRFSDVQQCVYYRTDEPVTRSYSSLREHALFRLNSHTRSNPVHLNDLRLSQLTWGTQFRLEGFVTVQNLSYEKEISARFTLDGWNSFQECTAVHLHTIPGSDLDEFKFSIHLDSRSFNESIKIELAVRYLVSDCEFWDNNASRNHVYLITWTDWNKIGIYSIWIWKGYWTESSWARWQ